MLLHCKSSTNISLSRVAIRFHSILVYSTLVWYLICLARYFSKVSEYFNIFPSLPFPILPFSSSTSLFFYFFSSQARDQNSHFYAVAFPLFAPQLKCTEVTEVLTRYDEHLNRPIATQSCAAAWQFKNQHCSVHAILSSNICNVSILGEWWLVSFLYLHMCPFLNSPHLGHRCCRLDVSWSGLISSTSLHLFASLILSSRSLFTWEG